MKICVLITTYQRNAKLLRLLAQIRDIRDGYAGENEYAVWVADSDAHNPDRALIATLCDNIIVNPGIGFDSNILNFYRNHAHAFDYVLSFGDDDLFALGDLNAFYVVDAAVKSGKGAVVFNHYDYTQADNGQVTILNKHFTRPELSFRADYVATYFLHLLPRYVGLLYSSAAITAYLDVLARFDKTLHLYAVPLVLAAVRHDVLFFDYPLFYFSMNEKSEGAWTSGFKVYGGLLYFLKQLEGAVDAAAFETARHGFFHNYLGARAWLRRDLEANGVVLPSEQQALDLLAAPPAAILDALHIG